MKNAEKKNDFGYIRIGAASPVLKVADPVFNTREMIRAAEKASIEEVQILVFPELSFSGYSCQDLFFQDTLIKECEIQLEIFLDKTKDMDIFIAAGIPVIHNNTLYNCGVAAKNGKILGVVPKTYLPNSREFYEKRWFSPGADLEGEEITIAGCKVTAGQRVFYLEEINAFAGIEICEDLWAVVPPSSFLCACGANIMLNLSASNEITGKASYRKELISQQSAKCICVYAYSSAGVHESTTDNVFSGATVISENGKILSSGKRFQRDTVLTISDADIKRLSHERKINSAFRDSASDIRKISEKQTVNVSGRFIEPDFDRKLLREINKTPFIPRNSKNIRENCDEIINIQTAGLAKRLEHTGCKNAVIGVSGGLDSTYALLVTCRTFRALGLPMSNIRGITMPGFGTTEKTYSNAIKLMEALGVESVKINITKACIEHFDDIGHDKNVHDTVYENSQARERTQILMDYANKVNGIVIGTGDLSEAALGWCTYNGDHMSMYSVNASIPKTLIIHLISTIKEDMDQQTESILEDVLDTPISPELLPPDNEGRILQKTEKLIGPYELHDFFLYSFFRWGESPEKIIFLAKKAFGNEYSAEEIRSGFKIFISRMFSQQFKRSCSPDGPKVGSVSLSPRGDWKMPSDACGDIWEL